MRWMAAAIASSEPGRQPNVVLGIVEPSVIS
jgi:hypothetical protein